MALVLASRVPAEATQPTVTVTPGRAHPLQRLLIAGAGFAAGETVDVSFDRLISAKVVAGPDGSFLSRTRAPRGALPGLATVAAIGEGSGSRARTTVLVRTNWPILGGSPARSGFNPFENVLSTSNVPGLQQAWTAPVGTYSGQSPIVVDGVVYVGSYTNDNLWALDAHTGAPRWRFPTSGPVELTPAVQSGIVYVTSDFNQIYAIDAATGAELWRQPTADYPSSPAVANRVVFLGGGADHEVHALDATTGTELWSYLTASAVIFTPAVADGVVYAGSEDDNLYALDASSGAKLWSFSTGGSVSSPTVVGGVAYVGSGDHNVYALDAASGAELWRFPTGGSTFSIPEVAVASGVLYVSSWNGDLFALDAATGAVLWRIRVGYPSSVTVAGGVVYFGGWDFHEGLYAVDAGTGAFLFHDLRLGWVGDSPTVINGTVYVSSSNGKVYCFDLTGPFGGCAN